MEGVEDGGGIVMVMSLTVGSAKGGAERGCVTNLRLGEMVRAADLWDVQITS